MQATNQRVKFENALEFLDRVKTVFKDNVRVYNQFLDVMKDFKAQTLTTPGVISRVKSLFKGHNDLLLGFNSFLPAGFKITLQEIQAEEAAEKAQSGRNQMVVERHHGRVHDPHQPPVHIAPIHTAAADEPFSVPARKQPEFDHARNYVKKIKMRFGMQPHIYKAFLDILHTYHKDQHSIQDVYDQVSQLFGEHPDLLEEFTQFLPDPEQRAQMKTPDEVARARQTNQRAQEQNMASQTMNTRSKFYVKQDDLYVEPTTRSRSKRKAKDNRRSRRTPEQSRGNFDESSNGSFKELEKFFNIKFVLPKERYNEFVKCLYLFNQDILTKQDLVVLVKGVLKPVSKELYAWFREFMGVFDEDSDEEMSGPLSEFDFTQSETSGPSYRALPDNIPERFTKCSGRTEREAQYLNDIWISIPTGSEESGGFKAVNKNDFEEQMFVCEDKRYHLDLAMQRNESALLLMMKLLNEIQLYREHHPEAPASVVPPDVSAQLNAMLPFQKNAIKQLYGNTKGAAVLRKLHKCPIAVIPVLIHRLSEKDEQWEVHKRRCNEYWQRLNEDNYFGALDYMSGKFKQEDKKDLQTKSLLSFGRLLQSKQAKKSIGEFLIPAKPQLTFKVEPKRSYRWVCEIVDINPDKTALEGQETAKVKEFLTALIEPFFNITEKKPSTVIQAAQQEEIEGGHCKPLSTIRADDNENKNIFFGNDAFYIFFRYFHMLMDRLARLMAMADANKGLPPRRNKDDMTERPNDTTDDKMQRLVVSVQQLIMGELTLGNFEDLLRIDFGIDSYILFTISDLHTRLRRQLYSLLEDNAAKHLVGLYTYELSNTNGVVEAVYYSNVIKHLGMGGKCYKFEFDKKESTFGITIIDNASAHSPKHMHVKTTGNWSSYVNSYVLNSETGQLPDAERKVYLPRNYRQTTSKLKDTEESKLEVVNDLEAKIDVKDYKTRYIEHSEDYLYRRGTRTQAKLTSVRRKSMKLLDFLKVPDPPQVVAPTAPAGPVPPIVQHHVTAAQLVAQPPPFVNV
mmetsp:Transcript_14413/g.15982  ORF Transcript_14413/g.15982 Transcript_14413/m.15982 type:complete len:1018 (-) Transcript_14413:51-3104(-)